MQLAPFPVVAPLLGAALLSALSHVLPRRLIDLIACGVSASVLVVCCILTARADHGTIVYWFGGWAPLNGFPIGISFVIDPIGAGLAAFVAFLVLSAFVFGWYYFESVKSLFHAVMLVFLAAMCGLALTGDLFNLFVWFELMSAAGVTLCGYHSDEVGPLQGAINFAVTNTLGAFLTLTGLAFLYAQTGALNMAQVGAALAAQNPGSVFVLVAFVFFSSAFLVKAAAFPFHFWLDDAHAVAPTPVCILFSGVMVELGLYAIARVYWVVFAVPLRPYESAVQTLFLVIGCCTALVGAIGCFGQRHLKRLLAFSTISHMGVITIGFALMDAGALAGSAIYVLGHGTVKAALFVCAGILLNRFETVDEYELQGAGRQLPWTGILMLVGAIGLAGVPPCGDFFGESKLEDSLQQHHLEWLSAVILLAGLLTSAAVLRVVARVFLGWGERAGAAGGAPRIPMKRETEGKPHRTPWTMWIAGAALLTASLALAVPSRFRQSAERAAQRMQDTDAYLSIVLRQQPSAYRAVAPTHNGFPPFWRELLALAAAAALALAALFPGALGRSGQSVRVGLERAMGPFRTIHSGRIGDYVAWFIFGVAAYGAFLLLLTRTV